MKQIRIKLGDVLAYEQPTKYIVDSTEYRDNYLTPVLTAGKSFILGYTNEVEGVFKSDLPVIIFDDFTTAIKFVDFPFKVKSSAMKILKANKTLADIRFLYYRMQVIKFDNEEHKRFWISKYSQIQISLPPLETQKKIASILDAADAYLQKTKALIAKYDELTQSLFLDMFGDPVRNEKGWEKKAISDLTTVSSGSTPSRENDDNFDGLIPWVKTGEVKGTRITQTEEYISETALANSSCKIYPINSIIVAMYGQGKTRGRVGFLGIEATTNQACAVIIPSKLFVTNFLFKQLDLCYEDLRSLGRGGNQPNLNSGLIKNYKVMLPPTTLQNQFAERVKAIEAQKVLAQESLKKSEELFNSLLQRAFKGEIV